MCSPSGISVDSNMHVLINECSTIIESVKKTVSVSCTLNNAQQQLATDGPQNSSKHDEKSWLKKDFNFCQLKKKKKKKTV